LAFSVFSALGIVNRITEGDTATQLTMRGYATEIRRFNGS
jgi:hypothetical protein